MSDGPQHRRTVTAAAQARALSLHIQSFCADPIPYAPHPTGRSSALKTLAFTHVTAGKTGG
jgi:hypothetical protein